jgi:hypothetical protein
VVDMTGVEILAMEEVATVFVFNFTVFWITFGIIFFGIIGMFLVVSCATFFDWTDFFVIFFVGAIFGVLFGMLSGTVTEIPTEYETQYKVTISDEVSMNEFLAKYEIVDQEGKIYTVRERE